MRPRRVQEQPRYRVEISVNGEPWEVVRDATVIIDRATDTTTVENLGRVPAGSRVRVRLMVDEEAS
jgi:hypothetical protein